MAAKAYVIIKITVGKTIEVVKAIRKFNGVITVDAVTGPYDAIAVIQAETLNELGDMVVSKVHPVAGISRTVTCIAV